MNKEQFKILINNQFKDANSPLRSLMYARNTLEINGSGGDMYSSAERFYASEFGLSFLVEYVQPNAEIPNEPIFQLRFSEMNPAIVLDDEQERFNLSGSALFKDKWTVEMVKFGLEEIIFTLHIYQIQAKDYLFSFKDGGIATLGTYDVKTGRFLYDQKPEGALAALELHRSRATRKVNYFYNSHDALALSALLRCEKVDERLSEVIKRAFEGADEYKTESTLSQIIKGLVNVK